MFPGAALQSDMLCWADENKTNLSPPVATATEASTPAVAKLTGVGPHSIPNGLKELKPTPRMSKAPCDDRNLQDEEIFFTRTAVPIYLLGVHQHLPE